MMRVCLVDLFLPCRALELVRRRNDRFDGPCEFRDSRNRDLKCGCCGDLPRLCSNCDGGFRNRFVPKNGFDPSSVSPPPTLIPEETGNPNSEIPYTIEVLQNWVIDLSSDSLQSPQGEEILTAKWFTPR
jgi:hypothetical protein